MFSSLRLVSFAAELARGAREEAAKTLEAGARSAGAASTLFAPTCPGVWNGGDLLWRSEFRDEREWRAAESAASFGAARALLADAACVAHVEHVAFPRGACGGDSPTRGLYRVALFCANQRASAARIAQFERETAAMPRSVRAIRRWQLARPVVATGARAWTHVWEQEYDDLAGLMGPYMLHPCHWGDVDRWFDPEDPDFLIDPQLCHTFCETRAPVIGAGDVASAAR
jgi:hypothetical protein